MLSRLIAVKRNVAYTQAYGCQLCVHVGSIAVMLGRRNAAGRRLELFTPERRFRWSNPKPRPKSTPSHVSAVVMLAFASILLLPGTAPAQTAQRVDITVWNATIDPFGQGDYFGTYDCWADPPPFVTILANFTPVPMPAPSPGRAFPHDQINFELFSGPTLLYSMSSPSRTHWTGTWWLPGSSIDGLPRFSIWWPHGQTGQWFRQPNQQWVLGPSRTHSGYRMPFSGILTLADGTTFDCASLNSGPNPGIILTTGGDRPDRPPDRIDFTITLTSDTGAPWPVIAPGDLNRDGRVDAGDLITFLGCWFVSDTTADFNRSGDVTTQDIFDFLAAYLGE